MHITLHLSGLTCVLIQIDLTFVCPRLFVILQIDSKIINLNSSHISVFSLFKLKDIENKDAETKANSCSLSGVICQFLSFLIGKTFFLNFQIPR